MDLNKSPIGLILCLTIFCISCSKTAFETSPPLPDASSESLLAKTSSNNDSLAYNDLYLEYQQASDIFINSTNFIQLNPANATIEERINALRIFEEEHTVGNNALPPTAQMVLMHQEIAHVATDLPGLVHTEWEKGHLTWDEQRILSNWVSNLDAAIQIQIDEGYTPYIVSPSDTGTWITLPFENRARVIAPIHAGNYMMAYTDTIFTRDDNGLGGSLQPLTIRIKNTVAAAIMGLSYNYGTLNHSPHLWARLGAVAAETH